MTTFLGVGFICGVCMYAHGRVYVSACECTHAWVWVCVCMHVCMCMYVFENVCVCPSLFRTVTALLLVLEVRCSRGEREVLSSQ